MSLVIRFSPPSLTAKQYDAVVRRLTEEGVFPTDGLDYELCFGSGDELKVSQVWDSREQLDAFGERLRPILAALGTRTTKRLSQANACRSTPPVKSLLMTSWRSASPTGQELPIERFAFDGHDAHSCDEPWATCATASGAYQNYCRLNLVPAKTAARSSP